MGKYIAARPGILYALLCVLHCENLLHQTEEYQHPMPKRTYQPKRIPRVRTHGFLSRMATRTGRQVITARRRKGRHLLSIAHHGLKDG